ncbi:MAG: LPS export ABC transporter permease LptF [Micavibrio sp.]|nr:MAG: LPS export ABC transporter permease LptF [Micavibrio sp.]
MKIFDFYLLRNLSVATIFIAVTLAVVIFLTQSLKFLELVINSGASSFSFWLLTMLALPRFFEIILPLALMAATVFIYNRMTMDSEIVVMRATGASPMSLAKPALVLAMVVTVLLWSITMWASPKSLSSMQQMRQAIKSQFSTLLFRENVFNSIIPGLTVYMRERTPSGEMRGLMIHDSREESRNPSTILAQRGVVVATDEGHQVLVYDGSRQEYDPKYDALHRLNFERYTIDLPDSAPVQQRWHKPGERTIFELISPDISNKRDLDNLRNFNIEIHRRISAPLLALVYTLIALNALLLGPMDRRGQGWRIALAIGAVVVIQGLFLAAYNVAHSVADTVPGDAAVVDPNLMTGKNWLGLFLMHALILIPLVVNTFFLTGASEKIRRKLLYKVGVKPLSVESSEGAA